MPSVGLGHSGTGVAVEAGGCWVGPVNPVAVGDTGVCVGISEVRMGVGSGEQEARARETSVIPMNKYLSIQFIALIGFISISEDLLFPQ